MSAQSHDLHLLTGAYALDALTADELAEFENHLDRCPSCAQEVSGLRETAARMAMAAAVEPPPGMRAQVLEATSRVRQLPPSGVRVLATGKPRRLKRLRRLPRPIAVAAMAAAIVVLAVLQIDTRHQLQQAQAGNRAVAAVLAAGDAQIELGSASGGGTVTAIVSRQDRAAVITAAGLPAQADAQVYQLWVVSAAGFRSAGLLPGSGGGAATSPVLADDVQPGDQLAITIEPAGGTRQPTTNPIAAIHTRA